MLARDLSHEGRIAAPRQPEGLDHTFATLLLEKGRPITYVAEQLGHAKPATTLTWYAH
jgi:integrase